MSDGATGSHGIYRFRNGVITLLASNPGNQGTNQLDYPKTDGPNVYYIHITPTDQELVMITAEFKILH